jgi:hypothetical protein
LNPGQDQFVERLASREVPFLEVAEGGAGDLDLIRLQQAGDHVFLGKGFEAGNDLLLAFRREMAQRRVRAGPSDK